MRTTAAICPPSGAPACARPLPAAIALASLAMTLVGCASSETSPGQQNRANGPAYQVIEVHVEAEGVALAEPLQCSAANKLGTWPFVAPGHVTVQVAETPLQLTCTLPPGTSPDIGIAPSTAQAIPAEKSNAQATGAKMGAGAGAAAAIAAAPIMGPLAALFVVGGAFRGAEIGNMVSYYSAHGASYPASIVMHVKRSAP